MKRQLIFAAALILLCPPLVASAQLHSPAESRQENGDVGIRFGERQTQRWQVGVIIRAAGPSSGIFATIPVPTDWPEQQVRIIDQETTRHVQQINFRDIDGGVKQMLVSIPQLNAGEEAKALLTVEITRAATLEPQDPTIFQIPRRPSRDLHQYLGQSPYIESRHPRIRSVARELADNDYANDWEKVEAIYDWVRENVEYQDGDIKGALAALRDGTGDCEEMTSLFVALCRAIGIPARSVWIPGHTYPEFYLEDDEGNGHWFPCQAAGTRAFGSMPEFRPILQKGDRFRVPEKRELQRYVAEFLRVRAVRGSGQPQVTFVRDHLETLEGAAPAPAPQFQLDAAR